jgi:ABC-2 type transport system ATP-binding protein
MSWRKSVPERPLGAVMGDLAIETVQLTKSFKGKAALQRLDLSVPAGSIFALLGRNGAGKSTTIKLLTNALKPDSGEARIFGLSVLDQKNGVDIRRRIGLVTEEKELYPSMNVGQMIRFTRPFFPHWREDLERRYLGMFALPLERSIPELSKGMRSKLVLLLALSHEAELLILDEPTAGLDPASAQQVLRELVSYSAAAGATIFFSSHQLAEVEQIADHVAILDQGRAVLGGALDDVKAQYQRVQVVFETSPPEAICWMEGADHIYQKGRTLSILASRNAEAIMEQARSLPGTVVERRAVTLQEIYLEHVGARDAVE